MDRNCRYLGLYRYCPQGSRIEDYLADPGEQRRNQKLHGAILGAGECVSRLRAELLGIRELFTQAVRGKRETPDLPTAVRRVLGGKVFAVIGFEAAEAARITGALEHAKARCRVFRDLPDNDTLKPFHAGVVNVCQGEGIFSWVNSEVAAGSGKPILFVGSAESVLRREEGVPGRNSDFLLGPWEALLMASEQRFMQRTSQLARHSSPGKARRCCRNCRRNDAQIAGAGSLRPPADLSLYAKQIMFASGRFSELTVSHVFHHR